MTHRFDPSYFLRKSLLFSSLDPASLSKISAICQMRHVGRGQVVFQQGDQAQGFFIVASGAVKIFKVSPSGQEHVFHMVAPGGAFAEAVVLGNVGQYPASAQAVNSATMVFVPRKSFFALMESDFSLTRALLSSLSQKLKDFNAMIEELSLKSADARLAKYLMDARARARSDTVRLEGKKKDLAGRLAIAPETLSRILARMARRKLIRRHGNEYILLRPHDLGALACGQS